MDDSNVCDFLAHHAAPVCLQDHLTWTARVSPSPDLKQTAPPASEVGLTPGYSSEHLPS